MDPILTAFIHNGTLANAYRLVARADKYSGSVTDMNVVAEARRVIAEAKDPARIKQAIQRELRARYKNLNITVI